MLLPDFLSSLSLLLAELSELFESPPRTMGTDTGGGRTIETVGSSSLGFGGSGVGSFRRGAGSGTVGDESVSRDL